MRKKPETHAKRLGRDAGPQEAGSLPGPMTAVSPSPPVPCNVKKDPRVQSQGAGDQIPLGFLPLTRALFNFQELVTSALDFSAGSSNPGPNPRFSLDTSNRLQPFFPLNHSGADSGANIFLSQVHCSFAKASRATQEKAWATALLPLGCGGVFQVRVFCQVQLLAEV